MDLFACKSLLFLLIFVGCSAGQDILPEGPVDAIVGRTVTIKTQVIKSDFTFIIWNFNHAGEQTNIATQTPTGLTVNTPYKGRVFVNKTNGYLTLGPLKLEDSGTYSIRVLSPHGATHTEEIELRVLGCFVGQDILSGSLVDAILGRTVTIKTQIIKSDFAFIIWNYNDGSEQTHIATQTASELKVNTPYEGRVCIDKTNGYLTLGPLKLEDSGTYSINVVSSDGTTHTEEITLRVLAPTTSSSTLHTFSTPEPTRQCTGTGSSGQGCSAGQDILPEGPVDAIVGKNVIIKTLIDKSDFAFIIWNFNHAGEQTHIATQAPTGLTVNAPYKGRVSINKTNGYLTLGPLKSEDSGDYVITALTADGTIRSGEIELRVLGCFVGQDILSGSLVDAILGRTVTIKTQIIKSDFAFIIWNYNDGSEQTHIATQTASGLKVNTPYEGRVCIDKTNGYLTLGPLKLEDSGTYNINVVSSDGTTHTEEITLRVLAPTTSSSTLHTFSTPEPTRQCTGTGSSGQGDVGPLVACVVVIVVLLAGYLLLLCRWIKHRNLRSSNSRNIELSVPHEKRPPDSGDYQTLNPASRDQDQIYSSLSDTHDAVTF